MSNLSDFLASGGGKLRYQEFTSSGTFTPSDALLANGGQCYYELIGGGSSGASSTNGAACGGDAGEYKTGVITVSGPVVVTIGAGGAAVTGTAVAAGNVGSASSIGALVTAAGGIAPPTPSAANNGGGGKGAVGIGSFSTDVSAVLDARGGSGVNGRAGGGGGTVPTYGDWHMRGSDGGGNAVWSVSAGATAGSGVANSGAGGGAVGGSTYSKTSGAGGSGWCRIVWFE